MEEESKTGQSHAEIKYDKNLDAYQVKSLRGSGCFLKINKKIVNIYYIYNILKNFLFINKAIRNRGFIQFFKFFDSSYY